MTSCKLFFSTTCFEFHAQEPEREASPLIRNICESFSHELACILTAAGLP
ncbi:hypothetical protein Plhal703r1_c38g0135121 [Plasmopara halstedii]